MIKIKKLKKIKLPARGWSALGGKITRVAHWCWATLPRRIISCIVIASIILSSFWFLFLKPSPAEAAWWDEDWLYRKKITIDETKIDEDLTDFPVLVKLTSTQLDFTKAQSAGQDIRFTDNLGNTLKYEIESWNQANSTANIWVKIPKIGSSKDTYFYMYYGNSSVSDAQDKNNVWDSSFKDVYHFAETAGDYLDSTSNNNNCASVTVNNRSATGQIGLAPDFESTSAAHVIGCGAMNILTNVTQEAWINLESAGTRPIIQHAASGESDATNISYGLELDSSSNLWQQWEYSDSATNESNVSTANVSTGSFVHVVAVRDSTKKQITWYVNGAASGITTYTNQPTGGTSGSLYIGARITSAQWFDGVIDELRISNAVRSAAWIKANYNSGNNTLLTYGMQEIGRGPSMWLKFDEGQGTTAYDSSIHQSTTENNGTISGALWTDSGKFNKALNFDGTDDVVTVAQSVGINLTSKTAYTISAWIYPNSDGEGDTGQFISKGANTYIRVDNQSGGRVGVSGSLDLATTDATLSISSAIPINQWSHIEMIYDSSQISIYVNGIKVGTSSNGVGLPATESNNLLIGGSTGANFDGKIDEVKIYPYARTIAQIKKDYDKGSAVKIGGDSSWIEDDLVGYWKMDESSGNAADSSEIATTLTNVGTTTFTGGKFSSGASLNGSSQYFSAADNATLSITGDLSLSAWIYADAVSGNYDIVGKWDGTNESYLLSLNAGTIKLCIDSSSNCKTAANLSLATSTWYLVTGTYDSKTQRVYLYVNGTEYNGTVTGTIPSSIADDAGFFHVGAEDSSTTATNYFDGLIDDVRVYNKTLSGMEVNRLYNWGPPPIAEWKMDEGSGASLQDTSENANTGTITGATWKNASQCHSGSCLSFDGNDYVALTLIPISQVNNYTVAGWLKTVDSGNSMMIWSNASSTNNASWFEIGKNTDNKLYFIQRYDGSNQVVITGVGPALNDGKWHHVAATRDVLTWAFYIDGVYIGGPTTLSGTPTSPVHDRSAIGVFYCATPNSYWNGSIDDVKIYNYTLTQRQIVGLYSEGALRSPQGDSAAVGYWKFDDGEGTVAEDSSGLANDLTLSAESWTMSGKFGKAWNGLGTNWLSKADDADFDFAAAADFSISTWFKSDSATNPASGVEYLVNKRTASAGYAVYMDTGGDIIFGVDDDTTWGPDDFVGDIGRDFYDNTWHHFVGVKTGTTKLEAYVDGKKIETKTGLNATATLENSALLYLGDSDGANNGDEFNGDLDETKIFRFAMTPEDVLLEYNQGKAVQMGSSQNTQWCPPGFTGTCTAPIAEWKMDDGSGSNIQDTSAGTNTGTITNATWKNAASCHSGSCLSFNGSTNYVNTSVPYTIDQARNGLTFVAWIKVPSDTTTIDNTGAGIVGCSYGAWGEYPYTAGGIYYAVAGSYGYVVMEIYDGTDYRRAMTTSADAIKKNTWYQIVGVFDPVTAKNYIYQNGVLKNSSVNINVAGITLAVGVCGIGRRDDAYFPSNAGNGFMDDVKIYNYALTQEQVSWLYDKGKPAGYWKFDEGQGTTTKDSTANNKTGTLTGGAAWTASGKFNSAIDFAGDNDFVDVGNTGLTLIKSVSLWVKPDAINVTEEPLDLNGTAYVKITNGVVTGEGFTSPTVYINGKQGSRVTAGVWNHIEITSGTGVSASDLDIGRLDGTYFNGLIDEVKIYNYQPTATQVQIDYNQGSAVKFAQ